MRLAICCWQVLQAGVLRVLCAPGPTPLLSGGPAGYPRIRPGARGALTGAHSTQRCTVAGRPPSVLQTAFNTPPGRTPHRCAKASRSDTSGSAPAGMLQNSLVILSTDLLSCMVACYILNLQHASPQRDANPAGLWTQPAHIGWVLCQAKLRTLTNVMLASTSSFCPR